MADEALYYGTGRRKNAVARVRLVPGTGKVTITGETGSASVEAATARSTLVVRRCSTTR